MTSILGIGEAMVELSPAGQGTLTHGFAGDVFNTLWYARALTPTDWDVSFYSGFGGDVMGAKMRQFIADAGIDCQNAPTIDECPTGLYMIHLDGAERSFSYWRDTSGARQMMRTPNLLWQQVANADLVYLSGITLAILQGTDAEMLLDNLRSHMKPDAQIAFDPNIRPRLWQDEDRMKRVISRAGGIADIVLPSFDDEAACFGDETPDDCADRYLRSGAKLVIVKNGELPTLIAKGQDRETRDVPRYTGVVDTTAAGDSFNGAFLARHMAGAKPIDAVQAGQICAGRVVCTKGALAPFATVQQEFVSPD
ncbi:sugar kinase [Paramylibacter ulvae]|nr:sugar kinase [Amylibacter ulvae]